MEYSNRPLPPAPSRLFLVGIGGIGMSGLAQLLVWQGYSVAGSDRGLNEPGKADLYNGLRAQGIRLYAQDGSGVLAEKPDLLIASTAVEASNPDLSVALSIPVMHRARALSQAVSAVEGAQLITIAGSCGKTSVTGWIASALTALGESVLMVNGGYSNSHATPVFPGNFTADKAPRWVVAEVDESDKSIAEFAPDYGLLLNIGNDHYSEDELKRVFAAYLGRCRRGVVCAQDLLPLAQGISAPVRAFAAVSGAAPEVLHPEDYSMDASGISFSVPGMGTAHSGQSGRHSASNAVAVLALLKLLALPYSDQELLNSLAAFQGIRQRFEVMGTTSNGIPKINDYAHNPEKVSAAIQTAHDRYGAPITAIFQPHGFTPLGFMRDELVQALKRHLAPQDTFIFLPVFYAGGTASFTPTSADVAADLEHSGLRVLALSREECEALVHNTDKAACILVMGARDSSLRPWTDSL